MSDLQNPTETLEHHKDEDLDFGKDAESRLVKYISTQADPNLPNIESALKINMGANMTEFTAKKTYPVELGENIGTPYTKTTESAVNMVAVTLQDDDLRTRRDALAAAIPYEQYNRKDKFFPLFETAANSKAGQLFSVPGNFEGNILISAGKYENENKSGNVTLYMTKDKFEGLVKAAFPPKESSLKQ